MSDNFQYIAGHNYQLSGSGISAVATSVTLIDFTDIYGNSLAMTDFGLIGYLMLEPKTTKAEIVSFTGVVNNGDGTSTLSGLGRGLSAKAPYTAGGFGDSHSGGAIAIVSNVPQFYNELSGRDNDETVNGTWNFTVSPTVPTPTNPTDAANMAFVQNTAQAGGVDALTTVKGISRISTSPTVTKGTATITIASPAVITFNSHGLTFNDSIQFTTSGSLPTGISASTTYYVIAAGLTTNAFEISATLAGSAINTSGSQSGTHTLFKTTPISVGDNDTRVPTQGENDALVGNNTDIAVGTGNKLVTQTGLQHVAEQYAADSSVSANTITVTLSPVPTSYTAGMPIKVKVANAVTAATTINVNTLGAKTIKKYVNGAISDLTANDIIANQTVTMVYDSGLGFMILQSPSANTPNAAPIYKNDITTHNLTTTTTNTIAHGLGAIPKSVEVYAVAADGHAYSAYNGTTQAGYYKLGLFAAANTLRISGAGNTAIFSDGTITYDATNITITWVRTGGDTGTASLAWRANT